MRPCFAFTAKTASKPAVLAIDNEIGFWGTQPVDFRNALKAVDGDELIVEINSPGGDVMAGLSMYNMLRNSGKTITTKVTGVAASIASVVMLAGDKREMPSNAFGMIHSVMGGEFGTAEELRDKADVIDKVQGSMRNIYIARMGIDEAKARELMSKDSWLTAQECLELGFATEIVDPITATASFDMRRADLPEHVASVFAAKAQETPDPEPTPDPAPEVPATPVAEMISAEAKNLGMEAHAAFFAVACGSLDEAKQRMQVAREITALCAVAGHEDKAAAHIRANASVADVRAALVESMASDDHQIDNKQPVQVTGKTGEQPASPPVVNSASIWASHNKHLKKGA